MSLRQDGRERRQQIFDAALRVFRERGYHAASAREIARAASISKANLYHYFPSKDELLYELAAPLLSELHGALDRVAGNTRGRDEQFRREILEAYLDICLSRRELASFLFANKILAGHPLLGPGMISLRERLLFILSGGSPDLEHELRASGAVALMEDAVLNFQETDERLLKASALRALTCFAGYGEPSEPPGDEQNGA